MKKIIPIILALLLIVSTVLRFAEGNKEESSAISVTVDGKEGTLEYSPESRSKGTVTVGEDVYTFEYKSDGYAEVTYEDGTVWSARYDEGFIMTGSYRSPDGESTEQGSRTAGDMILSAVESAEPAEKKGQSPLLYALLVIIGAFMAIWPKALWYVKYGFRYKDAEPSEASLFFIRAGGVLVAFCGVMAMIFE